MMTWEELIAIHNSIPEPEPVVFKLYYNEQGMPIQYSSENLPGNYIEVDAETFALRSMNVRVRDGQLWHLPPPVYRHKIQPSDSGTQCHVNDVAVVVSSQGTYWKLKNYEN